MSGYGPIVGSGNRRSRPFSLQDESEDPAEFDLRTPPKSPRPKSVSASPRSGSPVMGSLSDSYRATVPMLSRAQGDVNGPAQGVLGPPARLGDSSDDGNQPGGSGDADLVMGDGSELLPPGSVRATQGMLSPPGESSDTSQYGKMALTGTSRELSLGAGGDLQRVSATRREHLESLMARGYKCLFDSDGLGCVEFASEFCPCMGTLNGVPVFPGYY